MANKFAAVDFLRAKAVERQQWLDAADLLEEVAKNEQIVDQTKALAASAQDALESINAEITLAKVELKKQKDKAQVIIDDANASAAKAVLDAEAKAQQILANAVTEAQNNIAASQSTAAAARSAIEADLAGLVAQRDSLKGEIDQLERRALEANDATYEIEKKLEDAKKKLRALIEG